MHNNLRSQECVEASTGCTTFAARTAPTSHDASLHLHDYVLSIEQCDSASVLTIKFCMFGSAIIWLAMFIRAGLPRIDAEIGGEIL